ncbi:MAG: MFS transporter [Patescibacteria group bacterium]
MSSRVIIFFGNFFFSVSTALSIYVLLPYLTTYMSEAYTGLVIATGGFVALILFFLLPKWEGRYGAQQLVLGLAALEMFSFLALAVAPSAFAGTLFVISAFALQPCVFYGLDLLLEATGSDVSDTGRVRTAFLTAWNIGALTAPLLLSAVLINSNDYGRVFVVAAGMLVPFIVLLAAQKLPQIARGHAVTSMKKTLVCISHDRDFSAVTFAHFLLYLFYIWAPLYTPMYLHSVLGFPWSSLGWIFAIMLIPYVVLEYPAGWLADRYLGDKEMMFVGFVLAGGSLAALSVLTPDSSIYLVLGILFLSRVGAALVEGMTEGHFFRRMTATDINSMSFFRGVWPLAFTIGPLVASLIFFFGNFQLFFILTGCFIMITGVVTTLLIKDFR